mgnify:FL=1
MLYRDILGIFQCTKESNFSRFQKKMCFFEFFEAFFESFFNQKSPLFYEKNRKKIHVSYIIFNFLYEKTIFIEKKARLFFITITLIYHTHYI